MESVKAQSEVSTGITKATAKDSSRYALNEVLITPMDDGEVALTATDGRIMAVAIEQGVADREYLIPSAVMPTKKTSKNRTVALNGRWESGEGKFAEPVDPDCQFCPTDQILPDDVSLENGYKFVTLNPKRLYNLSAAIGGENGVTLAIKIEKDTATTVKKPIVVQPDPEVTDNSRNFGLLMPMKNACRPDTYEAGRKRYVEARLAQTTVKHQP